MANPNDGLREAIERVEKEHRQGDWTEEGFVPDSVDGLECFVCGRWPCSAQALRVALYAAAQPDTDEAWRTGFMAGVRSDAARGMWANRAHCIHAGASPNDRMPLNDGGVYGSALRSTLAARMTEAMRDTAPEWARKAWAEAGIEPRVTPAAPQPDLATRQSIHIQMQLDGACKPGENHIDSPDAQCHRILDIVRRMDRSTSAAGTFADMDHDSHREPQPGCSRCSTPAAPDAETITVTAKWMDDNAAKLAALVAEIDALRSTPAAPEDGLRVVEVYSGGDSDGNGEADLSVTLDAINADWLTDYLNGINAGFVFNRPVTLRSTPATPPHPADLLCDHPNCVACAEETHD